MVKKIEISGTAIVEGVSRNGVMYQSKELHKFADTMAGRPILKDHNNLTDNAIGKITHAESIENGKKVNYKGWVKEDGTGIVERIKDGRISEVSIGAQAGRMVKENDDSDIIIAKDMSCLEISTTPVPGVIGTSISMEKFSDNEIKEAIRNYETNHVQILEQSKIDNQRDNYKGGEKMESTEITKAPVTETVKVDETVELKAKLDIAEKALSEMKENQRQEAISIYNKLCAEKGVKAQDVSKATIEVVKMLSETVSSFVKETPKAIEEKKEIATPKTSEIVAIKNTAQFDNYVLESSELGGFAFYKNY